MIIGVMSDSHLREVDDSLKEVCERLFKNVDLIVHCGDVVSMKIINYLRSLKEVKAVKGNMDDYEVKNTLSDKTIFNAEGKRIGVIHGWGSPFGIIKRVKSAFEGENLDAIFFGHSHVAHKGEEEGIFFFNPGAFSKGWFTKKASVGKVEISGNKITGEHFYL